jgi:hypothetical protein
MASGEYKLARQRAGRGLYARVKVAVTEGDPAVAVDDDVFDWVKEVYGPNAFAYRDSDDFRGAAKLGAEHALRNLSRPSTLQRVRVVEIHVTTVDSTRSAVAFAACFAVWNALGDPGTNAPTPDQPWPDAKAPS